MKQPLVSIIVPVYNAEKYLSDAISSVEKQTYENWELLIIDDASSDKSLQIAREFASLDIRIKIIALKENGGVANARNLGIKSAKGSFLAFLDADDLWLPFKIDKQVFKMNESENRFTFTGYEFADEDGIPNGKEVKVPEIVGYFDYLKNNIIWTSTVMINLDIVEKQDIYMKDLSYGEDALAWLNILHKYGNAKGLNEPLSIYRRSSASLSANKFVVTVKKAKLYLSLDHINFAQKVYYLGLSLISATRKRV